MKRIDRRRVLKGILNSGAVTVGLPLLNCFLNGNGNALASGAPMPVRFGTWFWGCGMNAKIFTPAKFGRDFEFPEETAPLAKVKQHLNLFSNYNAYRDNSPNICHHTGWVISRTGIAPDSPDHKPGQTVDAVIAKKIGRTTRFPQLTTTATGNTRDTYSYENGNSPNVAEYSPVNFYARLFGPEFQDPNAPTFTPNPRTMVRKGVLSAVLDQTRSLQQEVGAEDKARLDQYFTGLRDLERQFDIQLTKPEPIAACHVPAAPKGDPRPGVATELVSQRHDLMTDLLVMAVACDQTRVFNMVYSAAFSNTVKVGYEKPHHTNTHEERIDDQLGYQPIVSWFTVRAMESWANYVQAFTKIKEGDGTLLDNCVIFCTSDSSLARIHSTDAVPVFTAGRGGGRAKTGLHIDGKGNTITQVTYTMMRMMGVDIPAFGTKSNLTSKEIGDILV
jgi:hypothetical protein